MNTSVKPVHQEDRLGGSGSSRERLIRIASSGLIAPQPSASEEAGMNDVLRSFS
jgi:hypothetical protein